MRVNPVFCSHLFCSVLSTVTVECVDTQWEVGGYKGFFFECVTNDSPILESKDQLLRQRRQVFTIIKPVCSGVCAQWALLAKPDFIKDEKSSSIFFWLSVTVTIEIPQCQHICNVTSGPWNFFLCPQLFFLSSKECPKMQWCKWAGGWSSHLSRQVRGVARVVLN